MTGKMTHSQGLTTKTSAETQQLLNPKDDIITGMRAL